MAYQPKSYRKFIVGAVSTAVVASSFAGVAGAASYSDVNSKYQEAVDFVVSKGIKGTSATTFGTYENIKRVDAAVFVASVLGLNTTSAPNAGFTDVPARAQGAVNALKAAGITSGKSATTFGAQDYITRGELAVWIQKGFGLEAGYQNLAFTDVPSQYANAVNALVSNKVTSGISATLFGTYENAKRGDFAVFLKKAADAKNIKPEPPKTPQILKIEGDSKGNKLVNGEKKTYTVTLTNPVSGKPVEGADINITFEENVGTDFGPQRNVTVTNPKTGISVIPYQANDGTERTLVVTTDKDGKATFTVTGDNATVTPIAFLDGSNQEWDTKGGIEIKTKDGRFDRSVEYYAEAQPVTFGAIGYQISVEGIGDDYAAIAQTRYDFQKKTTYTQDNGRKYKITVKKPDGTVFAGGTVNVGILEVLDGKLGTETKAYLQKLTTGNNTQQGTVTLNAKGEAEIVLASWTNNDSAEPMVWIDQNNGNADNGVYEQGEPVSDAAKVPSTNFQPARVDDGTAGAKLKAEDATVENEKELKFTLLNQSQEEFGWNWSSAKSAAGTYQVKNTGSHDAIVTVRTAGGALVSTVTIKPGNTETIALDFTNNNTVTVKADGGVTKVEVTANAVVKFFEESESQSVAVNAGPVTVDLGFTDAALKPISAVAQNFDGVGSFDQIVLTFDKELDDATIEAGDFRINGNSTLVANEVIKDKKKLIVKFSESALAGLNTAAATNLTYDAKFSGSKALADEFGNKAPVFTVLEANITK